MKLWNISFLPVLFCSILGCTIGSAHQNFIESVEHTVNRRPNIADLDYNSKYPNGYFLADSRYLTSKEVVNQSVIRYHFARPNIWEGRFCHYYLDVDTASEKVYGWGFDVSKSDPKIECGISG